MITCIEIENPYRYRSYQVGKSVYYDVQNFAVNNPDYDIDYGKITAIAKKDESFVIDFDSGNKVLISNGSGLVIVHSEAEK